MLKRIACVFTVLAVMTVFLSGCNVGVSGKIKGADVFMFKTTGNTFGDLMFEGFEKVVSAAGGNPVYKSPSEAAVYAQVEMLDTLITQKVASITISTIGTAGYDEVFKRAGEAGIKIISVDSAASPYHRTTHIEQTDPVAVGRDLVRAAVLIALGIDYPEDGDMGTAVKDALDGYTGEPLCFGILSSAVDTPIQNLWIECMKKELEDGIYSGKVEKNLEIKYGNDEPNESRRQADAFIAEDSVDVIISPTTVGMFAAGEALRSAGSDIKLTGLGLPSEMKDYMPSSPEDDAFSFVCPYMLLWNVEELGEIAATATIAAKNGEYDGKIGSTFVYNGKLYETTVADDGGTRVIALEPYVFHKGNIAEWAGIL